MSILKSALRTVFKPILPQLRYARRRWSRPHFAKAQRALMLRRLDPKHPRFDAFTDYAFSTVSRGEEAVAIVRRYRSIDGVRCLDIGTAYGGFPIAFAKAGAAEAIGMEIDPELLKLAKALLLDVPCNARIVSGSVMDAEFMASLGRFDIITSNDVIEHVDNPWSYANIVAGMLCPGGSTLHFHPKQPISQLRDLGSSLLRFWHFIAQAPRGQTLLRPAFCRTYDVTEFYRLTEYMQMFAAQGLDTDVLPVDAPDVHQLSRGVTELRSMVDIKIPGALDAESRDRIRAAVLAYVDEFEALYREWQRSEDPSRYNKYCSITGCPCGGSCRVTSKTITSASGARDRLR